MVQLKSLRPDLQYEPIRGNVDTRLRKCHEGEFDAIVLAEAGLVRLNLQSQITTTFNAEQLLPAVGQGALGIECRLEDEATRALLVGLNHAQTRLCVEAERAMNAALGGNCQVPVAGYAQLKGDKLCLTGKVGHPEKMIILQANSEAYMLQAKELGQQVAADLIQQGAMDIINHITGNMAR